MIEDQPLPHHKSGDHKDHDETGQYVVEEVDRYRAFNDTAIRKNEKETPDCKRNQRRHQSRDKDLPQKICEIEGISFRNDIAIIDVNEDNKDGKRDLREKTGELDFHLIALHENEVQIRS